MNINYKQAQFELFPGTTKSANKDARRSYLFSSLTLSLENIIVLSIFLVMIMIFAFSLGVERGKRVVSKGTTEGEGGQAIAATENDIVPPSPPIAAEETTTVVAGFLNSSGTIVNKKPERSKEIVRDAYTIQVASFKTEEYAKREADTLRRKEYGSYDVYVLVKGNYSIVCIGTFDQRSAAEVLRVKLKRKYKDCLIRKL